MVQERTGVVSMMGRPMTLLGPALKRGDPAPDFMLLDIDLKPLRLSDSAGKIRLLSIVPSLDTEVCALQTERFNREAQRLSADIVIYTISMDLPFAQKRWIEENQVHNVITASDFNTADFGIKYGLLLKEIRLLTRAVFIIGRDDHIVYMQIVPEITEEPDYAAVLEAIGKIK